MTLWQKESSGVSKGVEVCVQVLVATKHDLNSRMKATTNV
jgi:hypothetical protein